MISPYSRSDYVDSSFTTQTSIVRFIEDNWLGAQRSGGENADAHSGSLNTLFDFARPDGRRLMLNPSTGQPTKDESEGTAS